LIGTPKATVETSHIPADSSVAPLAEECHRNVEIQISGIADSGAYRNALPTSGGIHEYGLLEVFNAMII